MEKKSHCISSCRKLKNDNVAYFHTHNVVSHIILRHAFNYVYVHALNIPNISENA